MAITVLDFYADWCGPCKQQKPILEELSEEYDSTDVTVEFVDIEDPDGQKVMQKYNVSSLPTVVVLDEDENPLQQFVGVTQKDDLKKVIDGN